MKVLLSAGALIIVCYFLFIHKTKNLSESVIKEGISVIEEITNVPIPGYKIFNPGVLDLGDTYLVVYREKAENFFEYVVNSIVHAKYQNRKNIFKVVELDQNFIPITKSVQLIPRKDDFIKRVSDPRLFRHNGKIYIIFDDNTNIQNLPMENTDVQMLATLSKVDGNWEVSDLIELKFSGASEFYKRNLVMKNREKNWTPFSLDGKLYTVYLFEPEKIVLEIDINTGVCVLATRTENKFIDKFSPLRGGTPPVFDNELNEFISIYHVAYPGTYRFTGKETLIYLAGAYCFSKDLPFKITKKTIGPFYDEKLYNIKRKIVFPTGLIRKGDDYLMFYGEDDIRIKVARINRAKLISKMKMSSD